MCTGGGCGRLWSGKVKGICAVRQLRLTLLGRFPRRGLPFRNELLVEHEPVRGKREHPNALALLDPIGLDRCYASRSHERQGHLPAVDLDGINFGTIADL